MGRRDAMGRPRVIEPPKVRQERIQQDRDSLDRAIVDPKAFEDLMRAMWK